MAPKIVPFYSPPSHEWPHFEDYPGEHTTKPPKVEGNNPNDIGQMAFWYMMVLIILLLIWLIVFFCLRIIAYSNILYSDDFCSCDFVIVDKATDKWL